MVAARFIGWVLVLAGIIVLGRDLLAWRDSNVLAPISLGELWFEFHPASAVRMDEYLAPWFLWIVRRVLALWAALGFLVPGLVLVWAGRKRGRARRRR